MPSLQQRTLTRALPSGAARLFVLAISLLTAACQSPAPDTRVASTSSVDPVTLAVAGHRNDYVSLAANGAFVAAVWAVSDEAGVTDIYSATSRNEGNTFSAPVRVNDVSGEARANGEQPPRVTLIQHAEGPPDVVVLWTARRPSGTVMMTARSTDGGQTYGNSTMVAGTDAGGNRGWHALATSSAGAVHAAWLDHRRLVVPSGGASHQHHGSTPMAPSAASATSTTAVDTVATAQLSDLYFAGLGQGPAPRPIASGVCYCCKTAMAHGADGAIYLAWRHVYPGNMRDITFTVSRDGGVTFSAPIRVSEDGWSIAGCPDDGPAMAVDALGRVHVVWPTMVTTNGAGTKKLFHAMTADGVTFTPRVAIPHASDAHHPQIAATADNRLVVMWDEFAGETRVVASANGMVDASGAASFRLDSGSAPLDGRYPVVVGTGARVVAAWVSGSGNDSVVHVAPPR